MPSFFDPAPVHPLFINGPSGAAQAVAALARPAEAATRPYTTVPDQASLFTNPAGHPDGQGGEGSFSSQSDAATGTTNNPMDLVNGLLGFTSLFSPMTYAMAIADIASDPTADNANTVLGNIFSDPLGLSRFGGTAQSNPAMGLMSLPASTFTDTARGAAVSPSIVGPGVNDTLGGLIGGDTLGLPSGVAPAAPAHGLPPGGVHGPF